MPTVQGRPRLRGADGRLLRGYGPLIGIAAGFLLMMLLAPTVAPEHDVSVTSGLSGAGPGTGPGAGGTTASQGGTSGPTAAGTGAIAATAGRSGVAPAQAVACAGRQVPADPYAPPCLKWTGTNNGGATSPGVDSTTINVVIRQDPSLPDIGALAAQFTNGKFKVTETPADVRRTYQVLADYFNRHFEFYGRKINVKFFDGQGSLATEALGGGQDKAASDAVNAAQQQHAFAELSCITEPYCESLVKNKVMALNELYFSKDWFAARQPYAWSTIPDCTTVATATADLVTKELRNNPAKFAGGSLQNHPRKYGVIAPDTPIYKSCLDEAVNAIKSAGVQVADVRTYPLAIDSLQNNADQLTSVFSGEGITSVILLTDPVTPLLMGNDAVQQNWFPEWILTGVAFTDADFVGQIMNPAEWKHAFGVSYLSSQLPVRQSFGYQAYKSVSPGSEPADLLVEVIYYELEQFALGVQMAGPNLNPVTFGQGLRVWPGGAGGEAGAWKFLPAKFSPWTDGRLVWWDPNGISPYNNLQGKYDDNGKRYPIGGYPSGDPPVFLNGGP